MEYRDRLTGLPGRPEIGWSGRWMTSDEHVLDMDLGGSSRDLTTSNDLEAVEELQSQLQNAIQSESWDVLQKAPLVATVDIGDLKLETREELLLKNVGSIAKLTEDFITRIGEDSALVPVGRVKRPAKKAYDRLAGHSEDWAGMAIDGPIPLRALAVTRFDDPDLYENRMVNELIHPILTYSLSRRVKKLRRLVRNLGELKDQDSTGTYRRNARMFEFWGGDVERVMSSSTQASGLLRELENLLLQIQDLRKGTLNRALRDKVTGRHSLIVTNVIAKDRHYRAAGIVWRAFQRPADAEMGREALRNRTIQRHRTFDLYVLGLLIRSLKNLDYQPESDLIPALGSEAQFTGPWGDVGLTRNADGTLSVRSYDTSTRIVPLMDMVGGEDDYPQISRRWASLGKPDSQLDTKILVVYLGDSELIRNNPHLGCAIAMSSTGPDSIDGELQYVGVPVSPLEISSLERVARGMRIAIANPVLHSYPPRLSIGENRVPLSVVEKFKSIAQDSLTFSPLWFLSMNEIRLRRPPTELERRQITDLIDTFDAASNNSSRNREREAGESLLMASFKSAEDLVTGLMICPVCFEKSDLKSFKREDDVFLLTCRSCEAAWGLQRCGGCGERYPILVSGDRSSNSNDTGPGWVERVFGQDALSSPCWSREADAAFICSACRRCSFSNGRTNENCIRCHVDLN